MAVPPKPAADALTKPHAEHAPHETVKETVMSVILAFALAFVFRGFVVEAFVIPTGSMAPTLLGAHERFHAPETGYEWTVAPWYSVRNADGTSGSPLSIQNQNGLGITVHDPMSGTELVSNDERVRAGDRILVLKYLYAIRDPKRFDVIVFKNPETPNENFIKRLVGLPGEEIALIDGDVFARPGTNDYPPTAATSWNLADWQIQRKPANVQRAVWQPLFDSGWAPEGPWPMDFECPWRSDDAGWEIAGRRSFTYDSTGPTSLDWNDAARFAPAGSRMPEAWLRWSVTDRYAYNELDQPDQHDVWTRFTPYYPVSDLDVSAGIEPHGAGLRVVASIVSRGHEFEGVLEADGGASVRMRPLGDPDGAWTVLDSGRTRALPVGTATPVEFWHADQALWLIVDGKLVAGGPDKGGYDWQPSERIEHAMGSALGDLLASSPNGRARALQDATPTRPDVSWRFEGAPFTLHRVALARDIHYRHRLMQNGIEPARATHPDHRLVLNGDQFFACGDNSPYSHDGRTWDTLNPWVKLIDPQTGVVPREFLLGKAFFVYFPAAHKDAPVIPFVPDFGNLRFIN